MRFIRFGIFGGFYIAPIVLPKSHSNLQESGEEAAIVWEGKKEG